MERVFGCNGCEIETILVAYDQEGKILNIVKRKNELAPNPRVFRRDANAVIYNFKKRSTSRWENYIYALESSVFSLETVAL